MTVALVDLKQGSSPATVAKDRRGASCWGFVLRGCVLGLCLALGTEAFRVFLGSNLHAILPGHAYRSAQLSANELEQVVRAYGIRTVINLRGCCDPWPWYLEESRVTHRLQIEQEDICFSSGRLPSTTELRHLVEVLDRTEYPVLFHCRRGADRTGLASVILLLLHTDTSFAAARQQLGLRYGHLALARPAFLDLFLDYYTEWLCKQGLTHSREVFRRWAEREYCPGPCRSTLTLLEKPQFVQHGEPCVLHVQSRNDGIRPWRLRAGINAGIHLCLHVKDAAGVDVAQARAGLFDTEVPAGQSIELALVVPPLPVPGRYHLLVDMIDEQQSFFFQTGSEPLETELNVR